jgi:tetratricopeptide (TPR) repeat protein
MKIWAWIARLGAPANAGARSRVPDELMRRGAAHQRAAEYDKAEDCFREVLVQHPENAAALHMLADALRMRGYAHQGSGDLEAAIGCYLETLALTPAHAPGQAQVRNNLGNAYMNLGRLDDAIAAFHEAISLEPGYAEAHLNLGIAQQRIGDIEQATTLYRTALELKPDLAVASLNLGYVLEHEGDVRGAIECYRNAIAALPDFANAHFNLALLLLSTGDFAEGWEEYEWRLRLPDLAASWPYAGRARWNGEDLGGKVILLYAEQGFGDAIQFVRYAPLVAERGGRVIMICQAKLKTLFESVAGLSAVVPAGEPDPGFDVCCSLLSLPRLFGTTPETIPAAVPYLRPGEDKARRWKARLAEEGPGLKVGLYWSTDSKSRISRPRSLSLEMLSPLAGIPGVKFFSLQRGDAAIQAAQPPQGMTVIDPTAELADFADDAALISELDLVISINTATAHLAGALGKPVWALIHFPADWRWLIDRDDSPWYPTMRLFRRERADTWHDVIRRVGDALREFAGNAPGHGESA